MCSHFSVRVRLTLVLAAILTAGCASLLPKAKSESEAPWKTFEEIKCTFDSIEPGRTTVQELKQLGFDPFVNRNVLARFKNPLVILLLVASSVSALTGELTNFFIIAVMVLFSVTLDFVQEHRAGKAAASLRQSVSVRARVERDGKPVEIAVTEVVPGDLVVLSAGDMIPADGRVVEADDFFVKQALLTGEPYPVEKRPGELAAGATDIQDAANAVFMGTTVISGSARIRVVNTGAGTAMGAIADTLTRQPP